MHCDGKGAIMRKFISIAMLSILFGCTYSITQVHPEGSASDVVDDTQTNDVDASPTLSVPASVL